MNERLRQLLLELRPHAVFWILLWCATWIYEKSHHIPPASIYAFFTGVLLTLTIHFISVRTKLPTGLSVQRPNSNIRILHKNGDMYADIKSLIKTDSASFRRVVIVQYSGRNVMNIVDELRSSTSANIELYLVDRSQATNEHQRKRIEQTLREFSNELDRHAQGDGVLEIFAYHAPASMRVVLIDRKMLYIGSYFYKVMPISEPDFDVRGGEMPLFAISNRHPDFDRLSGEIYEMLVNWRQNNKAIGTQILPKQAP